MPCNGKIIIAPPRGEAEVRCKVSQMNGHRRCPPTTELSATPHPTSPGWDESVVQKKYHMGIKSG